MYTAVALVLLAAAPLLPAAPVDSATGVVAIEAAAEVHPRLAAARRAIAAVRALSFEARVKTEGPAAAQSPAYSAKVAAARADAGGWRLTAKGTATGADGKTSPLHLGYDAATAWSLRESEKAVFEKSVSAMTELENFFREHSGQAIIPWPLLADRPLEFAGEVTTEAEAEVDGIACEVLAFASPGGSGAGGGAAGGGATKGEEGKSTIRVYIAKSDGLPRRFDRVRELAAKDAATQPERNVQTLVLSELRTNAEAAAGVFTPPAPDGFAIRTAPSRPKRERREPDPLRGPDVRDKGGLLNVGMLAPEWSLKDPAGKVYKLADYRGKVVFMDFWATWCPPCRVAMPSVQRLHDHYANKDVVILGLNFNDTKPDAAEKYMKSKGFTYPVLLNAETLAEQYKITGIPAFFIVGKDGRIVYTQTGFAGGNKAAEKAHDEKMMKLIDDALAGGNDGMPMGEGMMEGGKKPEDRKPGEQKPEAKKPDAKKPESVKPEKPDGGK